MPRWDLRREQRRWRRELRDVPLSQLRGMVERDVFWQNPKKRRWAKRRLWWREHRWVGIIVTVLTLLIGTAAAVGTYINLYLTHARP
jgi:hypothetical protein